MFIWNAKLPDRWVATKEVWYDRRTKLPFRVFLFDVNGRILLSAKLGVHRPVEIPELPKEQWPLVATDYQLRFPDTESTLHIRLDEPKLKRGGAPNDLTFRFSPDKAGVSKVIQLDEDCGP